MSYWAWGALAWMAALLFVGTLALPPLGDTSNPISRHVEPYYIAYALRDTATPNLVTAILADYRGFDTLGETTVIFAAGVSVYLLLRRPDK